MWLQRTVSQTFCLPSPTTMNIIIIGSKCKYNQKENFPSSFILKYYYYLLARVTKVQYKNRAKWKVQDTVHDIRCVFNIWNIEHVKYYNNYHSSSWAFYICFIIIHILAFETHLAFCDLLAPLRSFLVMLLASSLAFVLQYPFLMYQ